MGCLFGFHINMEHINLQVKHISFGKFPAKHPYSGYNYYGITGITDKTCKLGVHTDYVRDTKDCMRIPVLDDDPTSNDLGGLIGRYMSKMAPGQA